MSAIKSTTIDERVHAYLQAHQPPEHPELTALRLATQSHPEARMQITPEQGHLLALLVKLTGGRHVLEIGTFTGYSALAMALAMPPDGQLIACDISAEWTSIGQPFWRKAGLAGRIDLRIGPALDTLKRLEADGGAGRFDLAFIDADKPGYDAYYEVCLRLVRPGGVIALDNMLRRGRVADPSNTEPDTVALRALNTKFATDERVDRVLLPIASGMTLARVRG
jgi:O-methyltransferase